MADPAVRVVGPGWEGMLSSVRIGTWNLGRSGAFHRTRIPRQLEVMGERHAHLWVTPGNEPAERIYEGLAFRDAPA